MVRYKIHLPPDFEVLTTPENLDQATDAWRTRRSSFWNQQENVVILESEIRILTSILPVSHYPETKAFYNRFFNRGNNLLLLRKKSSRKDLAPQVD